MSQDNQTPISLNVQGMSCQGCVRSVTAIISKTLELDREQVEVSLEQAQASFPNTGADLAPLLEKLTAQGFPSVKK